MTSPLEQCRDALRRLTGAAFPVSTEIDSSGYAWSHAYLYSALPGARAALAAADAALAAVGLTPISDLVQMPDGTVMHKDDAALTAQPEPSSVRQCALWVIDAYNSKRPDYLLRSIQKLTHALDGGAAPVAAPVAQPPEPDMRHPKIQRLIGAKARCEIELGLVEQLVEDPNFDATSMEMEYWGPLHDRLKSALEAKPVAQPLTDQQITAIVREAAKGSAIRRDGSTSHRIARAIESAHGIAPKEQDNG